jgi:L-asparaginase II
MLRYLRGRLIEIALGLALVASASIGPAFATQLEDALTAASHKDFETALKLLQPLAEAGDAEAQENLGAMYSAGQGVPQDHAEAAKWFRKAADQNNGKAQGFLGLCYSLGLGVDQDYVQAFKWLSLSGSRIPTTMTKLRETNARALAGVKSKLTPEQLAEAQRLAAEWKPTAP